MNEEVILICLVKFNNVLNVYEVYFVKGSKFIVGESFFLVDVFYMFYMNWVKNVKFELLENCLYVLVWVEVIIFWFVF